MNAAEDVFIDRIDDSLIGAERYAIGAMMLDGRRVPDVKALVRPPDFHDPRHHVICEAIYDLHQRGKPTDVISTGTHMRVNGKFVGFAEDYLHTLLGEVPTASNADHYASIVAGGAARRRLRAVGLNLISASDNPSVPVIQAVNDGLETLADAIPGKLEYETIGTGTDEFIRTMGEETSYIRTPWPDLDATITGWKPGRMVVVGARPAVGKTIVGVQIAAVAAQYGSVVYFSGEMDDSEILTRMYSALGGIRLNGFEQHSLSPEEWQRFHETRQMVERLAFYGNDRATTWDDIESATWDLHRKGNLKMIVVDYLSLYQDGGKHESHRHEMAAMSRRAKLLAKRLKITVVLLQQLGRSAETAQGEQKAPGMHMLKDTGNLEQDADCVILLHQPRVKNQVTKQLGNNDTLQLIVAKQRNGPTGTVDLVFEGQYARATHKFHAR